MENYKYPSRDEWLEVSELFPNINEFGFPDVDDIMTILHAEKSIKEVHLAQNLLQWDYLLNNKIRNLNQAFVNSIVNYNRGIAKNSDDFKDEKKVIQRFQYELYCEMTFYCLISVRDIILQIMNIAFELDIPEEGKGAVGIYTVKKKLKESDAFYLLDIVNKMSEDLKKANNIRNSIAHRFSELNSDRRSAISDDGSTYSAGTGRFIKYAEQVKIIKDSLKGLEVFFYSVKEKMIEKGYVLKNEE